MFCENKFFAKGSVLDVWLGSAPSQMFDWVLNMSLNNSIINVGVSLKSLSLCYFKGLKALLYLGRRFKIQQTTMKIWVNHVRYIYNITIYKIHLSNRRGHSIDEVTFISGSENYKKNYFFASYFPFPSSFSMALSRVALFKFSEK